MAPGARHVRALARRAQWMLSVFPLLWTVSCEERLPLAPARAPATGPLTVHPDNPRYLADAEGRAVLLTGSHTWFSLSDDWTTSPPRRFDFDEYLDVLERHGHTFMRLWRREAPRYIYPGDPGYRYAEPHPWPRTGPGLAGDGRPRFDLSRFDEAYFARLRDRVERAGARGIYVAVMLFEGHAIAAAEDAWSAHPFNVANNVNGIDGAADGDGSGRETHALAHPDVLAVQEAYVRKVVDTVNDLDNVLYEIANEAHAGSDAWQRHVIAVIRAHQATKPRRHPIIYSAPLFEHGASMWSSDAEIVAPGNLEVDGELVYRTDPPPSDGAKVVILDTDHLWGCGGEPAWVWKTFTRGMHPIYMDSWYDGLLGNPYCPRPDPAIRAAMGHVQALARRLPLARLEPRGELVSSGYCLAEPGRRYVAYVDGRREVTVDLRGVAGRFRVEWIDARRGVRQAGAPVEGGGRADLRSPFEDAAVLLERQDG